MGYTNIATTISTAITPSVIQVQQFSHQSDSITVQFDRYTKNGVDLSTCYAELYFGTNDVVQSGLDDSLTLAVSKEDSNVVEVTWAPSSLQTTEAGTYPFQIALKNSDESIVAITTVGKLVVAESMISGVVAFATNFSLLNQWKAEMESIEAAMQDQYDDLLARHVKDLDALETYHDEDVTQLKNTDTSLQTQINTLSNQVAANVSASTDTDGDYAAEVVDARVRYDGTTEASLGEALRGIDEDLQNGLISKINFTSYSIGAISSNIDSDATYIEWLSSGHCNFDFHWYKTTSYCYARLYIGITVADLLAGTYAGKKVVLVVRNDSGQDLLGQVACLSITGNWGTASCNIGSEVDGDTLYTNTIVDGGYKKFQFNLDAYVEKLDAAGVTSGNVSILIGSYANNNNNNNNNNNLKGYAYLFDEDLYRFSYNKNAENAENAVNAENAENAENAVNAENAENAENAGFKILTVAPNLYINSSWKLQKETLELNPYAYKISLSDSDESTAETWRFMLFSWDLGTKAELLAAESATYAIYVKSGFSLASGRAIVNVGSYASWVNILQRQNLVGGTEFYKFDVKSLLENDETYTDTQKVYLILCCEFSATSTSESYCDVTCFAARILDDAIINGVVVANYLADSLKENLLEEFTEAVEENIDAKVSEAIEEYEVGTDNKYIVCWGDSLTAGGGWTTTLQTLSGITVMNAGTGGENARCIAARQGADVMVTNDIVIPAAAEAVLIADRSIDSGILTKRGYRVTPLLQGGTGHVNPCKIGDIEGKLAWTGSSYSDTTGTWTFTRNEDGEEDTVITRPTAIRTGYDRNYNAPYLMVLFIGQNGGYTDIADLVNMHRKMIEHSQCEHFLVLGLSSGSASSRAEYEEAMEEEFGRYFLSLREYLSTPIYDEDGETIISCYGLDDQDLEMAETYTYGSTTYVTADEIAAGTVPHQLLSDSVHYTSGTKTVIGKLIYKTCQELGIF